MSETMTVRQACEHGYYVEHATFTRTIVPIDSHQEVVGDWKNSQSCPGGREITLRLIGDQKAGRVWVEV